jgi:hypothetical protein
VERPVATAAGGGKAFRSAVPWVLAGAVLVALAVVAVVVALSSGSSALGLPDGSTNATIHITLPRSGQPSFSGTLDGRALTGVVASAAPSSSGSTSGTLDVSGALFEYTGSLGGESYALHVSLDLASAQAGLRDGRLTFDVTGTYGADPVTGTAEFVVPSTITSRTLTVPFDGHVGTRPITGVAMATEEHGAIGVTAHVTVG